MLGIFSIMDVIFLAILIIAIIVGAFKGFAKQFFAFISFFIMILVASLLCEVLAEAFYPVFGTPMQAGYADWIKSNDPNHLFTTVIDWSKVEDVSGALSSLGIPALVGNLFGSVIVPTVKGFGECALVDKLAPVLTKWTLNVIFFVVIVILMGIILFIVKTIVFKIIDNHPSLGVANRILGAVVSFLYTYAVMSVIIMIVSSLLTSVGLFSAIQKFLVEQSNYSIKGAIPIFHFMYNYNFLGEFIVKQFLMMA